MSKEEQEKMWQALTKEYLTTEQKLHLIKEINIQNYDEEFRKFLDEIDSSLHKLAPELKQVLESLRQAHKSLNK